MTISAVTEKLPDFALLAREIERCGWTAARASAPGVVVEAGGAEIAFQTTAGARRAPVRIFRAEGAEPLVLIDLGDLLIGGQAQLFPRFLDFSLETRMALEAARMLAPSGWLVLMSGAHIDLFRLPAETLEFHVTAVREFEDELLPALAARAGSRRGRHVGTLTNAMDEARELRDWITHWGRHLAAPLEESPEDCEKFIWKLVLMLQAARKIDPAATAEEADVAESDPAAGSGRRGVAASQSSQTSREAKAASADATPSVAGSPAGCLAGWGIRCETSGEAWTVAYDSLSTHEDLAARLEEFDQTFSSRIFSGDAELHRAWLVRLEETSLAEQLRAELLMQSQIKFEAESVAWLWSDVEREQEGWRREVAGLPPVRRRIHCEGWQVKSPLVCDLRATGLGAALRDLDRIADYWADYALYVKRLRDSGETDPGLSQPDLFLGSPRGVGPSGELDDGVNFILSESFRVLAPESEEFGVGLAVLLKALTWPRRFDWPFFGIDTLDRMWQTE